MVDQAGEQQLSFVVHAHPDARDGWLDATIAVGGAFTVERDLQSGDQLTVQIATADGEIIASGLARVEAVGFALIKDKGAVVGQTRVHKAKVGAA